MGRIRLETQRVIRLETQSRRIRLETQRGIRLETQKRGSDLRHRGGYALTHIRDRA
jgi:hypothetical protein